jgi:hypothetical protein
MGAMLANRYLLDGRAAKALALYKKALDDNPDDSELQCRVILAHLELDRVDDVAGFIEKMLDENGLEALEKLNQGCKGYVPTDGPAQHEVVTGLRALIAGDRRRAAEQLHMVDAAQFPAVARLADRVENLHAH